MNITVEVDNNIPVPAYGFKVYYRTVGYPNYSVWPVNFFTHNIVLPGLLSDQYEGLVYSECKPGEYTNPTSWNTFS